MDEGSDGLREAGLSRGGDTGALDTHEPLSRGDEPD